MGFKTKELLSILDVNQCEATHSADLGGSSKYSNEINFVGVTTNKY